MFIGALCVVAAGSHTAAYEEQATASLIGWDSTQNERCMWFAWELLRSLNGVTGLEISLLQMCQSLNLDQEESAMMATSLFQYGKHVRVVSHPTMWEEVRDPPHPPVPCLCTHS